MRFGKIFPLSPIFRLFLLAKGIGILLQTLRLFFTPLEAPKIVKFIEPQRCVFHEKVPNFPYLVNISRFPC